MMLHKQRFVLALVACVVAPCLALGAATQFDFTNGDLGTTFGPGSMDYYNGTTTSDTVSFGTASSYGAPWAGSTRT